MIRIMDKAIGQSQKLKLEVGLVLKVILKVGEFIIAILNILGTVITILVAVLNMFSLSNNILFFYISLVAGTYLVLSSSFLYVRWLREHSRHRALRILAHRGRVNTINYMVYLDYLNHKFHNDYYNEPKTNSLVITRSKFTFHFFNSCESKNIVDVGYKHTFHLIKHGKKFDALILHAMGKLVREPQKMDSEDKSSTFIQYQNKYYPIIPEPCTGVRNKRNRVLDRIQCSIPAMRDREEILEFHYKIESEFNVDEDDIFIIYPQNYGKKFNKEAEFELTFDAPYFADIQLLTLPYDCIIGGPIQYVEQFQNEDGGKKYCCTVNSLKDKNIYMISIRCKSASE